MTPPTETLAEPTLDDIAAAIPIALARHPAGPSCWRLLAADLKPTVWRWLDGAAPEHLAVNLVPGHGWRLTRSDPGQPLPELAARPPGVWRLDQAETILVAARAPRPMAFDSPQTTPVEQLLGEGFLPTKPSQAAAIREVLGTLKPPPQASLPPAGAPPRPGQSRSNQPYRRLEGILRILCPRPGHIVIKAAGGHAELAVVAAVLGHQVTVIEPAAAPQSELADRLRFWCPPGLRERIRLTRDLDARVLGDLVYWHYPTPGPRGIQTAGDRSPNQELARHARRGALIAMELDHSSPLRPDKSALLLDWALGRAPVCPSRHGTRFWLRIYRKL